ncbi:hypothetical protein, conserved [Babesia ovata]|uniref:C3H1-type domain-containing protein n=1 Tax=Babesia ovata TaxID=189622 RepID=A0A2H6KJH8_9APIC|nr:uncharacterized protein BOVATA_046220 [Babesia ovata]GBE63129.1 hypothetical protein, conserved [Babesia ovata]
MGFIGGGKEVKKALLNGMHSNVNQLTRLLRASCGGEGCDDHKDVNNLQKSLTEIKQKCITYDALQTQIAQKLAENNNSKDSDSGDVTQQVEDLKRKLDELKDKILQESSDLQKDITNVIDAVQKKISELEPKKNSVDDLQSQVNDLKKKIEEGENKDENALKEAEEQLKDAKNNFPANESKSLDSHQKSMSSLRSLQTLCQHCKDVKNNESKTPKNILESLCGGLEKFLGFHNGNYTGSGIVYSDLDRLCDGVMSFLHGVLESVKDDESVTTYDNNNDINNVLRDLHDNVGKGRKAFGNAVDQVETLTKKVTTPINNLLTGTDGNNFKNISTLIKEIQGMQGKEYDEVSGTGGLTTEMKKSSDALNSVDKQLYNKLHPHVKLMHNAVDTFHKNAASDHEGLKTVCQKADSEFQTLNDKVERGFSDVTSKLYFDIDTLKHNVANKHKTALEASIQTAKQTLVAAESKAKKYVSGTFIINKRSHFDDKFKAIEQLLADIKHDGTSVASGRESKLRVVVNSVKEGIEALDNELNSGARQMGGAIDSAVNQVNSALGQLDEKVQADLEKLFGRIEAAIKGYVTKYVGAMITGIKAAELYGRSTPGVKALQDALNGSSLKPLLEAANEKSGFCQNVEDALSSFGQAAMKVTGQDDVNSIDQHPEVIISALFSDINRKVGKKFNNAHRKPENVPDLMENYHKWVTGKNGAEANSLKTKIDEIKKSLGRFFNRGENIDGNSEFNLGINGKFSAYHKKRQAAVTSITKILSNIETLEQIPEAVKQARSSVDGFLNEMKQHFEALNTQVQVTIKTLEQALRNLTYMIQDINREIDSVHTNVKDAIKTFHDNYLENSKNALTNLKKEALQQYAESKIKELENLKALVTKHSEEMQNIIDKDRASGIKGLLARILLTNANRQTLDGMINKDFMGLCGKAKEFIDDILLYVEGEACTMKDHLTKKENENSAKVHDIIYSLDKLLNKLQESNHFDHVFLGNLDKLKKQVCAFSPLRYNGIYNAPLLDASRAGMDALCSQLDKAYVNKYSGLTVQWTRTIESKSIPSDDSERCAKVFFTALPILTSDLNNVRRICHAACKTDQINKSNELGKFFLSLGYEVPDKNKKQWELQDKGKMTGWHVFSKLQKAIQEAVDIEHLHNCESKKQNRISSINLFDILDCLRSHLTQYNNVCHQKHIPKPRVPCSVYEMLGWCYGLEYNTAYEKLKQFGKTLHDDEKDSYLQNIMYTLATHGLPKLSRYSRNILTTILGTGDEDTLYASEFANNSLNLKYPSSGEECLQTLLDILRRVFPVLRVLHSQCSLSAWYSGWSDCKYGKGIATVNQLCNEHPADKPNCQATSQPMCQPNTEPNSQASCRPTSPLVSYLNDCLPGHLPHNVSSIGCKAVCSNCPKGQPGQPCLTPLGFRGFSGSVRQGKDLCAALEKFLLNVECSGLFAIAPKPPTTLPEHFSFTLSLAKHLNAPTPISSGAVTSDYAFVDSFRRSITDASINLYEQQTDLIDAICNAYGNPQGSHDKMHIEPRNTDLASLSRNDPCAGSYQCAPYLSSTCSEAYNYLAKTHSNLYLQWAIYLPWTLYNNLQSLLEAFKMIDCGASGCTTCHCKPGKHGVVLNCKCKSLVGCRGVLSVYYQYGFTFANAKSLYGKNTKTCRDFYRQLCSIVDSKWFEKIFEMCDKFLWAIRTPFSYLLLSLWSLSLLYLLHIAVVRLDVLRIRSHLRSPSSHRIAAQSLLAAARVRALANVKYFSP